MAVRTPDFFRENGLVSGGHWPPEFPNFPNLFIGVLTMVATNTTYKCTACGMTKTVPADQKVPTCCGKEMQKTDSRSAGEAKGKSGTCCSG